MPIFKRFDEDDIVRANPTEVTVGLWPGDSGQLTTFVTSSAQAASQSGEYYYDVYAGGTPTDPEDAAFAIGYGHRTGGGHPTLVQDENSTLATRAVYSQYRNLLLDPGDVRFTFLGDYDSDEIWVINIQRYLLKERLDAGNWKLTLEGNFGSHTFIDDSGQALGTAFGRSGKVFNVVSGTLGGSEGSTIEVDRHPTFGGYGLFYPSLGIIVLNPGAIGATVGLDAPETGSVSTPQYNHEILYDAIVDGGNFLARSAENISSTHYFARLKAREFNYTNNPTFFDEVSGAINNVSFIQDPRVYLTQVGLYNDSNELLAIAKTSQPIQKAFDKEVNLKVRLDF
jgi:hypothetical protein